MLNEQATNRNLAQAAIKVGVEYLYFSVVNVYRYRYFGKLAASRDYEKPKQLAEAIYGHSSLLNIIESLLPFLHGLSAFNEISATGYLSLKEGTRRAAPLLNSGAYTLLV